jgi:hypothetical protein
MGEIRNAQNFLAGKCDEKRFLARPRHRWEDDIETDCKEIGCEIVY